MAESTHGGRGTVSLADARSSDMYGTIQETAAADTGRWREAKVVGSLTIPSSLLCNY